MFEKIIFGDFLRTALSEADSAVNLRPAVTGRNSYGIDIRRVYNSSLSTNGRRKERLFHFSSQFRDYDTVNIILKAFDIHTITGSLQSQTNADDVFCRNALDVMVAKAFLYYLVCHIRH